MAIFHVVGIEAKDRLKKALTARAQVYVPMVKQFEAGKQYEFAASEGETLRAIRVNLVRTANKLGVKLNVGETVDGTLLVIVPSEDAPTKSRKARQAVERS